MYCVRHVTVLRNVYQVYDSTAMSLLSTGYTELYSTRSYDRLALRLTSVLRSYVSCRLFLAWYIRVLRPVVSISQQLSKCL